MRLHFDRAGVDRLLAHVREAQEHATLYDEVTGPGLWLVGDNGVYLMSNGKPPLMADPTDVTSSRRFVVYAREIDPNTVDFNTWWELKRSSFGGDDGSVFIPLTWFDNIVDGDIALEVTPIAVGIYTPVNGQKT